MHLRVFNVLDGFLLFERPASPLLQAIVHSSQDDFGDFQSRVTQTDLRNKS